MATSNIPREAIELRAESRTRDDRSDYASVQDTDLRAPGEVTSSRKKKALVLFGSALLQLPIWGEYSFEPATLTTSTFTLPSFRFNEY